MPADFDTETLRRELVGLFKYVQRVRQEIAAINKPADEELEFEKMGDQLDAIVKATEDATNTIMGTIEKNEDLMNELRKKITDADQLSILDEMSNNGLAVFEACSFQDITGQRISKVVKSVCYVEDRVNALVETWGRSELDKIVVEPETEKSADELLLAGPQLEGGGLAQDEIDKLFD